VALVLRWAILAGAFWVTTLIVDGIQIEPGAWNYFWVAALFGLINTVIGSLLKLFTLPAVILTFGLFIFIINAAMLMLTDRVSDTITIDRFTSALIGSLLISIFSIWIPGFAGGMTTFSSVAVIHAERSDLLSIAYFFGTVAASLFILYALVPKVVR